MLVNPKAFERACSGGELFKFEQHDVVQRVWKVAHELPEDGNLALFDVVESKLVILNALGAAFWTRLDGEHSLGEIALEISEAVHGAPGVTGVIDECTPFLSDLMRRGAIARR